MGELELPAPDGVPAVTPPPPAGTSIRERLAQARWNKLLQELTPAIALGLGILSQTYAKHTVAFAPKAVALLVVAWALAAGVGAWLPEPKPGEPHPRWRNLLRRAAATVTVGLFRNVLFFLVPVWFASSTLGAFNMIAPILLAAVALYACFPNRFRQRMLEHPRIRTIYCSSVLFVALVPAAAVETSASPRLSAALAAARRLARVQPGDVAHAADDAHRADRAGRRRAGGRRALRARRAAAAAGPGRLHRVRDRHRHRRQGDRRRGGAIPRRHQARVRLVPGAGAAALPPGHSLRVVPERRARGQRRRARDRRWARTGLPDFLVYVVAQTGLMAGRFADGCIPAHRAETLRRRVARSSCAPRRHRSFFPPIRSRPSAARSAIRGRSAADAVWQKPFDYDTGHLQRLAVLAPEAAAEPDDLIAYALDFKYEQIQKELFLHALPFCLRAWQEDLASPFGRTRRSSTSSTRRCFAAASSTAP